MVTTAAGPCPRADPSAPRGRSREQQWVPRGGAGCAPCHPRGAGIPSPELLPHRGLQGPPGWRGEGRAPTLGPRRGSGAGCPPSGPRSTAPPRGSGASTSAHCPLVGTRPLPGDARLPRKRDVPLLGAVPAMPSALRAPGGGTEGWGGGVRSHPSPHATGKGAGAAARGAGKAHGWAGAQLAVPS